MILVAAGLAGAALWARAADADAQSKDRRPQLVMVFPNTYNKVETALMYGEYINSLQRCSGVELVNLRAQPIADRYLALDLLSESELLDRMVSGQVGLAQVTSGMVPIAVDTSNGDAFAARGNKTTGEFDTYDVKLVVPASSGYKKALDLKGATIAHSVELSNSGNLVPRAYLPYVGLLPDRNYKVVYSGGEDRSALGIGYGFWQAGIVASDVLARMVRKGEIREADVKVLWSSSSFPVEAMVLDRRLPSKLRDRIKECTLSFRFSASTSKLFNGSDGFVPIDMEQAYANVRFVLARTMGGRK